MNCHDKELWELVLKKLERKIRSSNLLKIQSLYDALLKSKSKGENPMNLEKIIQKLQKKLSSRVDFRWRYNLKENRMYTFEELKAKRDIIRFPEQSMTLKTRFHKKRLEKYLNQYDATSEFVTKRKKLVLQKELEELSFERFIKKKTLADKGSVEEQLYDLDIENFDQFRKKNNEEEEIMEEDFSDKESSKAFEIEEMEKKKKEEEREQSKKKFYMEKDKKDKAKMGKGKNKARSKMLREQEND